MVAGGKGFFGAKTCHELLRDTSMAAFCQGKTAVWGARSDKGTL